MSESGQTRSSGATRRSSAYPPSAEFEAPSRDVSVVPNLDSNFLKARGSHLPITLAILLFSTLRRTLRNPPFGVAGANPEVRNAGSSSRMRHVLVRFMLASIRTRCSL
jgi:hypothetical protein